jgi:2-aminoadipate transaminase
MKKNKREVSFNRGVPATKSLPKKKVGEVAESLLNRYGESLLQYGDSKGFKPLREELADWYEETASDAILVGNGSLQILDIIANLYVSREDTVIVESPSYDRAITIFRRAGAEVHGVKLEKDGPNLEELETLFETHRPEIFYTIPDFQNPTGVCVSGEKRREITRLAEKYGVLVVEDSPYRRLRYGGEPEPTLREFNPDGILQMSSFSKLIGPGVRVGWVVGGEEIIDKLSEYAEDTYITPGLLSQGIVFRLIEEGWLEDNIEDLVSLYEPRLETTLDSLKKYFPESDWVRAQGGFFVGLWLPEGTDVERFYERANENGLVLSSPEGFFPDRGGEGFVRLPFPALSPELIEEGVKRLGEVWRSL